MASIGKVHVGIVNARVASGENSTRPRYTPAHEKDGVKRNSRVEFTGFVNRNGSSDKDGNRREGRSDAYRFVAWGGLADALAKGLSMGQEFSCDCDLQTYQVERRDAAGKSIVTTNGNVIKDTRYSLQIIAGTFIFGNESAKTIANEIASGTRPANWNIDGHPDRSLWLDTLNKKNAAKFTGGDKFFNADVVPPKGGGEIAYGSADAKTVGAVLNATAPMVEGLTYEMLIANKWTDEQIMASKYASLIPVKSEVPPPPAQSFAPAGV